MKSNVQAILILSAIVLGILWIVSQNQSRMENVLEVGFDKFVYAIENKQIENVTISTGSEVAKVEGKFKDQFEDGKKFTTTGGQLDHWVELMRKNGITPNYKKSENNGFMQQILISWLPMIPIIFIFLLFMRQLQSGSNKALSFGKSKAKRVDENKSKVKFADVAGCDEAKGDLEEIVEFLKNPKKFTKLGGRIPKGVLLVGEPGTGKTLLAKAVAGEASVPFYSISGSDFVEMFVGVGASRVRSLFENAKKTAPCLVFIDEIDAVGRHRGAGMGGGHDEREQTLNQLLVEMDGFEGTEGVILIAATNRVDVLDPALLRPGRFDRRVNVDRPDVTGRIAILKVHTKSKPISDDVNLQVIGRATPGFTGANLENLVNESALNAARNDRKSIMMKDFEFAKDKLLMGAARKSMVVTDEEKNHVAYHEAGHAIIAKLIPENDPVYKVTIVPRGPAMGYTATLPTEEKFNITRKKAEAIIAYMMGGRIAEELIFGHFTTGASNDIERATDLARKMVTEWGMSNKLGPLNYSKSTGGNPFLARDYNQSSSYSQATMEAIDVEIKDIVDRNYQVALKLMEKNKDKLIAMSETLLKYETINAEDVENIMLGKEVVKVLDPEQDKKTTEVVENSKDEAADKKADSKIDLNKPIKT